MSRGEKDFEGIYLRVGRIGDPYCLVRSRTVSLGFGFISCVIGAMAATAQVDREDPKRKDWKHAAIGLMVFGCVFSLIALIDIFVLPYLIR